MAHMESQILRAEGRFHKPSSSQAIHAPPFASEWLSELCKWWVRTLQVN